MESHFAYGSRAGIWRILDLFDAFGARAAFSACGRAVAATPLLAAEPHARGHEVSAHGWRWERHAGMPEAVERAVVARAVEAIGAACGERPVGWHTRSAASANTRRLLMEEGGFLYDSDAYDDDLPRFPFEEHVTALTRDRLWPRSTDRISQFRLAIEYERKGSWRSGPGTLMLDVVDYPGEWLLDLALIDQSYTAWSRATISGRRW